MAWSNRIVFIELDGASWSVMDPLIQKGELPNIQQLMGSGASGELLSERPLLSPRLWASIFSGKNSKKHGVEFFGNPSSMVKCKRVWDIFNDKGFIVGVFGSFGTWPPYPVGGFMIPSLFAIGPETYPEEYRFFQELTLMERKRGKTGMSTNENKKSLLSYALKMKKEGVSLRTLGETSFQLIKGKIKRSPKEERYWRRANAYLEMSTEFFLQLYMKYRPDFSTFHIHNCDALSHRYWKYFEPDKFQDVDSESIEKYRHVIPDAYKKADRMIGKIMKTVKDAVIIVMSDHGSTAMELLKTSYRLHVENFLDLFKLREKVIPANIGLVIFYYFQDKGLMNRIFPLFEKITFIDTGEKVFKVLQEESLIGLSLSHSLWRKEIDGDRIIDLDRFGRCKFNDLFIDEKMEISGTHNEEGVLIIAGPAIKKGGHIEGATIYDITPTTLTIAGFPVAKDMDGRVLESVIKDDFLRDNPIRFIESYETDTQKQVAIETEEVKYDMIKDQLKSLGYL